MKIIAIAGIINAAVMVGFGIYSEDPEFFLIAALALAGAALCWR